MRNIIVKVHQSKANLKKKDQLAWKIAEIASDKAKINKDNFLVLSGGKIEIKIRQNNEIQQYIKCLVRKK